MKKLMALLIALICLFGSAVSESPATPTDLVEINDNDAGEITIPFERKLYLTFLKEPQYYGDETTLVLTFVDFKKDDQYVIYWQYSINESDWITIEGAHEQTYTFILNEENAYFLWRGFVELKE